MTTNIYVMTMVFLLDRFCIDFISINPHFTILVLKKGFETYNEMKCKRFGFFDREKLSVKKSLNFEKTTHKSLQ